MAKRIERTVVVLDDSTMSPEVRENYLQMARHLAASAGTTPAEALDGMVDGWKRQDARGVPGYAVLIAWAATVTF